MVLFHGQITMCKQHGHFRNIFTEYCFGALYIALFDMDSAITKGCVELKSRFHIEQEYCLLEEPEPHLLRIFPFSFGGIAC